MIQRYILIFLIIMGFLNSKVFSSAGENLNLSKTNENKIVKELDETTIPKELLEKLNKKEIKEPVIIKTIIPNSSSAKRIVFFKDKNSCPVIAKLFNTLKEYEKEYSYYKNEKNKKILGLVGILNELNSKCGYKIPIITNYKGKIVVEGLGFILADKAEGKEVGEYFNEIPFMNDEKIHDIFYEIGAQFGELDYCTTLAFDKILFHGDSHANNYLYDENKKQLYWIDWSGTTFVEATSSLSRSKFFTERLADIVETPVYKDKTKGGLMALKEALEPLETFLYSSNTNEKKEALETLRLNSTAGLRLLSESERKIFEKTLIKVIEYNKKRLMALKSFGEGYCKNNPDKKDWYNGNLEKEGYDYMQKPGWKNFIDLLHSYEAFFDLPSTFLIDPSIK